jgi:hypothetical protein
VDSVIVSVLATILVIGLILFAYIASAGRKSGRLDRAAYRKRWQRIEQLQSQGETGWQVAIFEADKLLDQALKEAGYPGQTMGDRLKDARSAFRNTDHVWQAHKLRNRLAHEHDIRLNTIVVARSLRQFKAGLKDLGAL